MSTYILEIPDAYTLPDYVTPLTAFIDSEQSAEFLERAASGDISIKCLVDTLKKHNALPFDSAEK